MSIYNNIDTKLIKNYETVTHKLYSIDTGSEGVTSTPYISGSTNDKYWRSLHSQFYLSGSPVISSSEGGDSRAMDRFSQPLYSFGYYSERNPQYRHKFHGYNKGTIINIPQKYMGEEIKRNSFKLLQKTVDIKGLTSVPQKTIRIQDDGYGNLYSVNAHHSQSTTALSSSENYIGNIFYEFGIAVITETGSWSGSVNYSDVASASNFTLDFKSTQTIFGTEYEVTINPGYYISTNASIRGIKSGSYGSLHKTNFAFITGSDMMHARHLHPRLTASDSNQNRIWNPYITQIQFYGEEVPFTKNLETTKIKNDLVIAEPLIVANLPKPVKVSKDVPITFRIRIDK
tara:strand:+ start:148 stop:1176 length:1029 start_codon:yes stop_codon:yes gene_type:complete